MYSRYESGSESEWFPFELSDSAMGEEGDNSDRLPIGLEATAGSAARFTWDGDKVEVGGRVGIVVWLKLAKNSDLLL